MTALQRVDSVMEGTLRSAGRGGGDQPSGVGGDCHGKDAKAPVGKMAFELHTDVAEGGFK